MAPDFVPASSMASIPNSSYRVRLGKIGETWAIRVFRGQQVLATEIIGELDPQVIVTVVQSAISLPSYSPYHIVRAVSPLINEAKSGYVPQPEETSPRPPSQPTAQSMPQPTAQPTAAGHERNPPSISEIVSERVEEALTAPRALEKKPTPTAAAATSVKPVVQAQTPPKPKAQKKLILKPVDLEEEAKRIFSTLMLQLGLTVSYVSNNYGERSTARLWQYLGEAAELKQAKRKGESFEDFIKRRVEEDRILGIEHEVVEFYEDRFASRVRRCKLKNEVIEFEQSGIRSQQDLPCMLCESTWQGACRAMGFKLQHTREKDGCTLNVEKPETKR